MRSCRAAGLRRMPARKKSDWSNSPACLRRWSGLSAKKASAKQIPRRPPTRPSSRNSLGQRTPRNHPLEFSLAESRGVISAFRLPGCAEEFHKPIGIVGDDAVDAGGDQFLHLRL